MSGMLITGGGVSENQITDRHSPTHSSPKRFDGVIALDETHKAKNSGGPNNKNASKTAMKASCWSAPRPHTRARPPVPPPHAPPHTLTLILRYWTCRDSCPLLALCMRAPLLLRPRKSWSKWGGAGGLTAAWGGAGGSTAATDHDQHHEAHCRHQYDAAAVRSATATVLASRPSPPPRPFPTTPPPGTCRGWACSVLEVRSKRFLISRGQSKHAAQAQWNYWPLTSNGAGATSHERELR